MKAITIVPFKSYLQQCYMKLAIVIALLTASLVAATANAADLTVGVYYFPGWHAGLSGAPAGGPWKRIEGFSARKPKLGWYDDSSVDTIEVQLKWMHEYGLKYVIFDWYWSRNSSFLEQSLKAYFQAPSRELMPFALLWANHDAVPRSKAEFQAMVTYWIENYFRRKEAFRIQGRPVVFIFDNGNLEKMARTFGETSSTLIAAAQSMMRSAGLPDIYFVSSTFNDPKASSLGYAARSTYNYHGLGRKSHSYSELDQDYRKTWEFQAKYDSIPYIVPMTQGWDRRPWGGSEDAAHDNSGSTPVEFERHLMAARDFMQRQSDPVSRMGVICCWNEFGEGSYIEPTEEGGFSYLEKVKKVFGSP